ncbi:unnamed protein product, partial [Urochloa humidicola]
RSVPIEGEEVHPYRVSLLFARLSRGNAPCRWYINPEVPEAKALLSSLGDMNRPIKWDNQIAPNTPAASVEEKKISEIIKLNPFKNKVTFIIIFAISVKAFHVPFLTHSHNCLLYFL